MKTPVLDVSNLNPKVLEAEYAVRGAIAVRSQEHASKIADGEALEFSKVVQCNIGEVCLVNWVHVTTRITTYYHAI